MTFEKTRQIPQLLHGDTLEWNNVVIIDCYTPFAKEDVEDIILTEYNSNQEKIRRVRVFYADINNPHMLNRIYEKAIEYLIDKDCKTLRVVYDALSDFLRLTDIKLATLYLRHNSNWEYRHNVESMYMFKAGTLPKETEEYFLWFFHSALKMNRVVSSDDNSSNDYIAADFRGPFPQAKSFRLNFSLEEIYEKPDATTKNKN